MYKALRFHNYYGADVAARRPVIDDEGLTERSTTPVVRHVGQLTYGSSRGVRRDGLRRILRSCQGSLCENSATSFIIIVRSIAVRHERRHVQLYRPLFFRRSIKFSRQLAAAAYDESCSNTSLKSSSFKPSK